MDDWVLFYVVFIDWIECMGECMSFYMVFINWNGWMNACMKFHCVFISLFYVGFNDWNEWMNALMQFCAVWSIEMVDECMSIYMVFIGWNGWMVECMSFCEVFFGWNGWVDEWMLFYVVLISRNKWIDKWVNGRMDEWMSFYVVCGFGALLGHSLRENNENRYPSSCSLGHCGWWIAPLWCGGWGPDLGILHQKTISIDKHHHVRLALVVGELPPSSPLWCGGWENAQIMHPHCWGPCLARFLPWQAELRGSSVDCASSSRGSTHRHEREVVVCLHVG